MWCFVRILPRSSMAATTKRLLLWLGVAFVVYTIVQSPAKAADLVQAGFDGISSAGQSLGEFFDALVS
jgi:hypothetical protein